MISRSFFRSLRCSSLRGAMALALVCFLSSTVLAAEEHLICHFPLLQGRGRAPAAEYPKGLKGRLQRFGEGVEWAKTEEGTVHLRFRRGERRQNGYLEFPLALSEAKELTLELQVKFEGPGLGEGDVMELVSNARQDRGPGFRLFVRSGRLRFNSGPGGYDVHSWGAFQEEPTLAAGAWYQITATWDGSYFRIYVDGASVAVSDPGLKITNGPDTLQVGSFSSGLDYGLDGWIREIKIHDRALTAAEISQRSAAR